MTTREEHNKRYSAAVENAERTMLSDALARLTEKQREQFWLIYTPVLVDGQIPESRLQDAVQICWRTAEGFKR